MRQDASLLKGKLLPIHFKAASIRAPTAPKGAGHVEMHDCCLLRQLHLDGPDVGIVKGILH